MQQKDDMMNIQHAMTTSPAKINDLFARLADTSDGAVKKREAVFTELASELHLMAELEEKHLLPLLARHEETKAMAAAAREDNKATLRQLKELGQVPKGGDAFTQRLASLRKAFQQSVRDDRGELLPAVQKVIGKEEAAGATGKTQSGAAEAEQSRRDEADQAKVDAKAVREEGRREAEAARAAEQAREATEQVSREAARQAATTLRQAGDVVGDAAREGAGRMAEGVRRATASLGDAAGIYRDAASGTAGDLQAVASASGVAARGMAEVRRHWNEHLSTAFQDGVTLSQRLMRCKTGREVAEAQRDYARLATRAWFASQVRILEATQQAAADALPALRARLGEGQGQPDGARPATR